MSTLAIDTILDYPAGRYPRAGRCHLRIFRQGTGDVVLLATDLGDENPGASVTNAIETIVATAVRVYELENAQLMVVEHYDDRRTRAAIREQGGRSEGETRHGGGETFDLVTLERVHGPEGVEFENPAWRHIEKDQAERLIGQPLP